MAFEELIIKIIKMSALAIMSTIGAASTVPPQAFADEAIANFQLETFSRGKQCSDLRLFTAKFHDKQLALSQRVTEGLDEASCLDALLKRSEIEYADGLAVGDEAWTRLVVTVGRGLRNDCRIAAGASRRLRVVCQKFQNSRLSAAIELGVFPE